MKCIINYYNMMNDILNSALHYCSTCLISCSTEQLMVSLSVAWPRPLSGPQFTPGSLGHLLVIGGSQLFSSAESQLPSRRFQEKIMHHCCLTSKGLLSNLSYPQQACTASARCCAKPQPG